MLPGIAQATSAAFTAALPAVDLSHTVYGGQSEFLRYFPGMGTVLEMARSRPTRFDAVEARHDFYTRFGETVLAAKRANPAIVAQAARLYHSGMPGTREGQGSNWVAPVLFRGDGLTVRLLPFACENKPAMPLLHSDVPMVAFPLTELRYRFYHWSTVFSPEAAGTMNQHPQMGVTSSGTYAQSYLAHFEPDGWSLYQMGRLVEMDDPEIRGSAHVFGAYVMAIYFGEVGREHEMDLWSGNARSELLDGFTTVPFGDIHPPTGRTRTAIDYPGLPLNRRLEGLIEGPFGADTSLNVVRFFDAEGTAHEGILIGGRFDSETYFPGQFIPLETGRAATITASEARSIVAELDLNQIFRRFRVGQMRWGNASDEDSGKGADLLLQRETPESPITLLVRRNSSQFSIQLPNTITRYEDVTVEVIQTHLANHPDQDFQLLRLLGGIFDEQTLIWPAESAAR